jgi:hypothetical protein
VICVCGSIHTLLRVVLPEAEAHGTPYPVWFLDHSQNSRINVQITCYYTPKQSGSQDLVLCCLVELQPRLGGGCHNSLQRSATVLARQEGVLRHSCASTVMCSQVRLGLVHTLASFLQ